MRYGDDFLVFASSEAECKEVRKQIEFFLKNTLFLSLHTHKRNLILSPKAPLRFLGVEFFQGGRKLMKNSRKKVRGNLNSNNAGSYYGLVLRSDVSLMKEFDWILDHTMDIFQR